MHLVSHLHLSINIKEHFSYMSDDDAAVTSVSALT